MKKKLAIIAGVHGDEIGTIYVASMLKNMYDDIKAIDKYAYDKMLNESNLESIEIYPVMNIGGMKSRTRQMNEPYGDLNRCWNPVNARNNIEQIINDNDIIIDMHSSATCVPMFYLNTQQENANLLAKFADKIGVSYTFSPSFNETIKMYVSNMKHKLCITWEQPGLNRLDYDLCCNVYKFFYSILIKEIGFIDDLKNTDIPPITSCGYDVVTKMDGIFVPSVPVGTELAEGEIIGRIVDPFTGKTRDYIKSPELCRISCFPSCSFLNISEIAATVQPIATVSNNLYDFTQPLEE